MIELISCWELVWYLYFEVNMRSIQCKRKSCHAATRNKLLAHALLGGEMTRVAVRWRPETSMFHRCPAVSGVRPAARGRVRQPWAAAVGVQALHRPAPRAPHTVYSRPEWRGARQSPAWRAAERTRASGIHRTRTDRAVHPTPDITKKISCQHFRINSS